MPGSAGAAEVSRQNFSGDSAPPAQTGEGGRSRSAVSRPIRPRWAAFFNDFSGVNP